MIVVAIILLIVFYCLPLPLKLLLTAVNSLIPDHIPIIDELIMASGTFAHFFRFIRVTQFAEDHPVLAKFILTLIVLAVIVLLAIVGYMIFTEL